MLVQPRRRSLDQVDRRRSARHPRALLQRPLLNKVVQRAAQVGSQRGQDLRRNSLRLRLLHQAQAAQVVRIAQVAHHHHLPLQPRRLLLPQS